MDTDRFDAFTQDLAAGFSRRGVLVTLGSAVFAAIPFAFADEGEAKKNRRKKKKKHPCTPNCSGKSCGSDGCGGTCGRCNGPCVNGACICPSGSKLCNGTCQQCCEDVDCEAGAQVCRADGACGCADGRPLCGGVCCIPEDDCLNSVCVAISDRNLKTNVASIDPAALLERVRELPIATWNYISDDAAVRHIGPMAQDFAALFDVGADDRHIHPIDGQGVALAAIQGLAAIVEGLAADNVRLAARFRGLEAISPGTASTSPLSGTGR